MNSTTSSQDSQGDGCMYCLHHEAEVVYAGRLHVQSQEIICRSFLSLFNSTVISKCTVEMMQGKYESYLSMYFGVNLRFFAVQSRFSEEAEITQGILLAFLRPRKARYILTIFLVSFRKIFVGGLSYETTTGQCGTVQLSMIFLFQICGQLLNSV